MTIEPQHYFLQAVLRQIESHHLLDGDDRWLLAVSGGPDSIAMLHALHSLRQTHLPQLQYLHVAHLNHQLRGADSDLDAQFVRDQAQTLDLPVTVAAADVADLARRMGQSVESTARHERLRFLLETAQKQNCQKIALAHNADDNVETILHRILRGTGIRGLAGIPPRRPAQPDSDIHLIRPLLPLARAEIELFLQNHHLPFRIDSTNLSTDYTRNRIRHQLLPLLRREFNPNTDQALLHLAHTAQLLQAVLADDADQTLSQLIVQLQPNTLILNRLQLAQKPRILQTQIIWHALQSLHVPQQNIGFPQITAILDLIAQSQSQSQSQTQTQSQTLQLPAGLTVTCRHDQLCFQLTDSQARQPLPSPVPVPITVPGSTDIPPGYLFLHPHTLTPATLCRIHMELCSPPEVTLAHFQKTKSPHEELLDADKIVGPLQLRPRRPADRFTPLGASGSKSLSDFLTDAKIPLAFRDRLALLCDDDGIICLPTLRIADRVKITPSSSRFLKLTFSD